MKKNIIILSIMVGALLMGGWVTGCTSNKEKLNQTEISGNDVDENVENKELKIVSSEDYKFDSPIMKKPVREIYYDKDGNVILANRVNYQINNAINTLNEIELKNGVAKVLKNESKSFNETYDNKRFYMEPLENGKVKIYNKIGDKGYVIDYSVTEETPFMTLLDNVLLIPEASKEISSVYKSGFKWVNLENNYNGKVVFDKLINVINFAKLGNKLYIIYSTELAVDYSDNLMILDLDTSKIELDTKIDNASYVTPIDGKRVLLEKGQFDTAYSVSIYNLESKTYKELITWEAGSNWMINPIGGGRTIKLSPSGEKILYGERKGNTNYLRVAEIDGMNIKESKEIFSSEGDDVLESNFSDDGKSIILIKSLNPEVITEIKFNK